MRSLWPPIHAWNEKGPGYEPRAFALGWYEPGLQPILTASPHFRQRQGHRSYRFHSKRLNSCCRSTLLRAGKPTGKSALRDDREGSRELIRRERNEKLRYKIMKTLFAGLSVHAFIWFLAQTAAAGELALTIYNQNFAVVRDSVPLDLKAGVNQVRFADATTFLEPSSVILRDRSGQHQFQVLEQNFR